MNDAEEAFLGPDLSAEVSAEFRELADELRRGLDLLCGARPETAGELAPALKAAQALSAALEPLPAVGSALDRSVRRPYDPNRFNPISGTSNPIAPPLVLWTVGEGEEDGPDGRRSEGKVTFGLAHQGPPDHTHGGAVAAMFDDFLGRSQHQAGFTGTFTVTFRKPTPLRRELTLKAWISRIDGRKRWVSGTCHLDGVLLSEAEGLFLAPRAGSTIEELSASLPQP